MKTALQDILEWVEQELAYKPDWELTAAHSYFEGQAYIVRLRQKIGGGTMTAEFRWSEHENLIVIEEGR